MRVYSKGHEKVFKNKKKPIFKSEESKIISSQAKKIFIRANFTNRQSNGSVLFTEKIAQKNCNPINVCVNLMKLQII